MQQFLRVLTSTPVTLTWTVKWHWHCIYMLALGMFMTLLIFLRFCFRIIKTFIHQSDRTQKYKIKETSNGKDGQTQSGKTRNAAYKTAA